MALKFSNNASSLLAVTLGVSDTVVQVASGEGTLFPSLSVGETFVIALENNLGDIEFCLCTSRTGDLLTVTRGQEGTSIQNWTANETRVELRLTKAVMEAMLQSTDAAATYLTKTSTPQATVKGRAATAGTGDAGDLSAAQLIDIIETADGSGSGLDADTVDGIQGSAIALIAGNNAFSGNNTFSNTNIFSAAVQFTSSGGGASGAIQARSNVPVHQWYESDGPSDEKYWEEYADGGDLILQGVNDAYTTGLPVRTISRSGVSSFTVNYAPSGNVTLTYGGLEVGYRNGNTVTFGSNHTLLEANRGKLHQYNGGGGHTLTINPAVTSTGLYLVICNAQLNVNVSSGTLFWFTGGAGLSTGARSAAAGSTFTVHIDGAGNAHIWGAGIT